MKILNKIKDIFYPDYFGLVRVNKNIQLKLAIKAYHRTDTMIGYLEDNYMNYELINLN